MAAREAVIVDTGGANLASLHYALERLGAASTVSADAATIRSAERVILPGVGAARDAMDRLRASDLVDTLRSLTQPVLGICLGLHLLARHSSEDDAECLGLIDEAVVRLPASEREPVPHMGWNRIRPLRDSVLTEGIEAGSYFYFVHSYAMPAGASCVASCDYGFEFSAVIECGNLFATQFHPERSADLGARLLANFLRMEAC